MKRKILITAGIATLYSLTTNAQNIHISGTVKDKQGAISGISLNLGDSLTTITDQKGKFDLHVDKHFLPATLKVKGLSYTDFSLHLNNIQRDTTFSILLDQRSKVLDEVIVSASRRPENIRNIVSSVNVVSSKKLEMEMAINPDLSNILANQIPGFAPTAQTGNNVGQNLRGRPMLVMIDGVSQSSPLRNAEVDLRAIDPAVLQRIEVVKGATAIYGNGASGGLVNYVTIVPDTTAKFAGRTQINFNGSLVNPENSMGGRINQRFHGKIKKFDYVVSGMYEQTGEYKDASGDVVGPNYSLGETDSYNTFLKIGFEPNAKQRLQFTYNLYSSLQNSNFSLVNGDIATGQKATGILGKPAGIPTGVDYNHNLHLSYFIENLFLNSSLNLDAYYEKRKDVFYVSTGRFDGGDGQSLATNDKKGARMFLYTPIFTNSNINANLSYGFDLLRDKTAQPLVDGRIWVPTMDMTNLAPFVQADFTLLENLIFKTGFRYEDVKIKVDDYKTLRTTNAKGETLTPSFAVTGGKLKYNTGLFNVGLKYNKLNIFSPFLSFSQGFSVMDIGLALRDAKVNSISKINTDAVKVNNYEVGFESRLQHLTFSASAYRSTSKLGIEVVFDPNNDLFNTVRNPEKIYGFELAANYLMSSALQFGASYSYTEGKRDVNDNGRYNDPEDSYLNGRRISAPKITGNISYTPTEVLNLTVFYTGIANRNRFEKNIKGVYNGNEGKVNAYNLFSFAGIYKVKKNTQLTVGIDNIFNEDYFPARAQWFMQPGFYSKGRGRSFNVGLTVNY